MVLYDKCSKKKAKWREWRKQEKRKDGGIWRPEVAGGGCIFWCVWGAVGRLMLPGEAWRHNKDISLEFQKS